MPMSVEDAPEPLTLDLPGSAEVPLLVRVRQWAGSALNDLVEDHSEQQSSQVAGHP
jgi:hypothetical protein